MYLLQITTEDFGLQLKTEVTADTVGELQVKALEMVKSNPAVVGMKYIIAKYNRVGGKLIAETLKVDIIRG